MLISNPVTTSVRELHYKLKKHPESLTVQNDKVLALNAYNVLKKNNFITTIIKPLIPLVTYTAQVQEAIIPFNHYDLTLLVNKEDANSRFKEMP